MCFWLRASPATLRIAVIDGKYTDIGEWNLVMSNSMEGTISQPGALRCQMHCDGPCLLQGNEPDNAVQRMHQSCIVDAAIEGLLSACVNDRNGSSAPLWRGLTMSPVYLRLRKIAAAQRTDVEA
jgi:hypothetical protein